MADKIYRIRRNRNILKFSLALEKLGYIQIFETGQIKLPVQLLVPEKELEPEILKVFSREEINLATPEKDLNALLEKLLKARMNIGSIV